MCSVPLDLFSMLELGGQQPSTAMVSMNQLTTGQHLSSRRGRKKTTGIPNPKRMFEEVIFTFLKKVLKSSKNPVWVQYCNIYTKKVYKSLKSRFYTLFVGIIYSYSFDWRPKWWDEWRPTWSLWRSSQTRTSSIRCH